MENKIFYQIEGILFSPKDSVFINWKNAFDEVSNDLKEFSDSIGAVTLTGEEAQHMIGEYFVLIKELLQLNKYLIELLPATLEAHKCDPLPPATLPLPTPEEMHQIRLRNSLGER